MDNPTNNFEIPQNIDQYISIISKIYANKSKQLLQKIVVNAKIEIIPGYDYDNLDNKYGHALNLIVPESIYLSVVGQKEKIEYQIRNDINRIHNVRDEYIARVLLEVDTATGSDWRRQSGVLVSTRHFISTTDIDKIWIPGYYRVFLSHTSTIKEETASLKEKLKICGISCFVAHTDIHPTKEWQIEIEKALSSMDALVALMTNDFHDSNWTDQEIGFAFGKGVPIISVRLGKDPYGFIGKFQALSCSWELAAIEIVKILIKDSRMVSSFIKGVHNCENYENANTLSQILSYIDKLSPQQVNDFINAFNDNSQVRDSFGFNGKRYYSFGGGLPYHLQRVTGHNYQLSKIGEIEVV